MEHLRGNKINVVAIKKNADQIIIAPGADAVVGEVDIFVVVCNKKTLADDMILEGILFEFLEYSRQGEK